MRKVMVGFLIFFTTSVLAEEFEVSISANAHPAAVMVKNVLQKGLQIVAIKGDEAKKSRLCQLVKESMGTEAIGLSWLGRYSQLPREQKAVARFINLTPSIIVTRMFEGIDSAQGGRAEVDAGVKSKGLNQVEVSAHVYSSTGRHYAVGLVVDTSDKQMKIVDGIYMGFSGVNYLGKQYKRILDRNYNRDPENSKPVTDLIRQTESDSEFVPCP